MRIMAIDYGDAHTGIAISDPTGLLAGFTTTINAYRRCRRVVDLGGSEDELLEELGRKARFSQHTLTEEEREAAWARLEAAKDQLLARRGGWRKALVWLIRPLL